MASLNDVISDNDIEMQRLMEGLDTTRGTNSYTKTKRLENYALLHDDFVHGGFCQTCANRLLSMKADCPICRGKINCVLKVIQ